MAYFVEISIVMEIPEHAIYHDRLSVAANRRAHNLRHLVERSTKWNVTTCVVADTYDDNDLA